NCDGGHMARIVEGGALDRRLHESVRRSEVYLCKVEQIGLKVGIDQRGLGLERAEHLLPFAEEALDGFKMPFLNAPLVAWVLCQKRDAAGSDFDAEGSDARARPIADRGHAFVDRAGLGKKAFLG